MIVSRIKILGRIEEDVKAFYKKQDMLWLVNSACHFLSKPVIFSRLSNVAAFTRGQEATS